jgi:hypothetical protein
MHAAAAAGAAAAAAAAMFERRAANRVRSVLRSRSFVITHGLPFLTGEPMENALASEALEHHTQAPGVPASFRP